MTRERPPKPKSPESMKTSVISEVDRPVRKTAVPGLKLPERWVVWARTKADQKYLQERLWVQTVFDDDPASMPLRLRSLIVKECFADMVGQTVEHHHAYSSGVGGYEAVAINSLSEPYAFGSFSKIHEWFKQHNPDALANDCELLRKKQRAQAIETRTKNEPKRAWHRTELEKRRNEAPRFAFEKGFNKKRMREQWQYRSGGILYVLDDKDTYDPAEGIIPVEEAFDIVPGQIILVKRI